MESYLLIACLSTPIHTYPVDTLPDAGRSANFGRFFWVFLYNNIRTLFEAATPPTRAALDRRTEAIHSNDHQQ
jgi:hypothetical protein